MIPSFLITFRETFEAALVIGIMYAYLTKTRNDPYKKYVTAGTVGGVLLSVITAIGFNMIAGGFAGRNEQIFEGATMMIASVLVTSMILWMASQRHLSERIKQRMQKHLDNKYGFGILLFSAFAVYREGVEIILFLNAAAFSAAGSSAIGASLGIFGAMLLGYLFFKAALHLNLKQFFLATGALLIIIAAGLVAHGAAEFQEAGVLPFLTGEAWNTKSMLSDQSEIGAAARSLLGYNDNPTILEAIAYFGYLAIVVYAWRRAGRK